MTQATGTKNANPNSTLPSLVSFQVIPDSVYQALDQLEDEGVKYWQILAAMEEQAKSQGKLKLFRVLSQATLMAWNADEEDAGIAS